MGQVIKVFLLESCDGLLYEAESEIWLSKGWLDPILFHKILVWSFSS